MAAAFWTTCILYIGLPFRSAASRSDSVFSSSAVGKASQTTEGFTTNAICAQNNCINPVVPGISDLPTLTNTTWQCQDVHNVKKYASFCRNALYYNPAVPNPSKSMTLESAVRTQDNAASTMYFYALSGMNLDPWSHRQPWLEQSSCLTAVWKTLCSTYFPRAEAGCKAGEATKYLRPCKNVCENYLKACNVECCDESVQCVFNKKVSLLDGQSTHVSGYYDEDGPSAMCTGAASTNTAGLVLLTVGLIATGRK